MKRRLFLKVLACTAVTPRWALAANPLPYITSGAHSPADLLSKIGGNAAAFTGGTVSIADIRAANKPGVWKIAPIGGGYETAGITGGRANYWREPAPSERAVWILKNGTWVPAFLVKCGNPIRKNRNNCCCDYENQTGWF
jgi:hypothetical protein